MVDHARVTVLNRMRLGARLAAAFAIVVLLLLVVMATALTTAADQGDEAERMARAQRFVGLMKDAKFDAADFNGWQTAYAFDVHRGVADAAQDSGSSRATFLKSIDTFTTTVAAASEAATNATM